MFKLIAAFGLVASLQVNASPPFEVGLLMDRYGMSLQMDFTYSRSTATDGVGEVLVTDTAQTRKFSFTGEQLKFQGDVISFRAGDLSVGLKNGVRFPMVKLKWKEGGITDSIMFVPSGEVDATPQHMIIWRELIPLSIAPRLSRTRSLGNSPTFNSLGRRIHKTGQGHIRLFVPSP